MSPVQVRLHRQVIRGKARCDTDKADLSRSSLFVAVDELAKVFNEADNHDDSRSRQPDKKGDFEQSHEEQNEG